MIPNGAGAHTALVETEWLAGRLGQPGLVIVDCTVQHYAPLTGGIELKSGRLAGSRATYRARCPPN